MAYVHLGMESEAVECIEAPRGLHNHNHKPIMRKARELFSAVLLSSTRLRSLVEAQASGDLKADPPFEQRWANFKKVMASWHCELIRRS